MKFYINQLILWQNNGERKVLDFLPNKVNVITGNSETGKSSIIKIIDYCFLASKNDISPKFIGEHVSWYGINFYINDKHFTIGRGATTSSETRSYYYFSDNGNVPELPIRNIKEEQLKSILQTEFSINNETVFAGGSDNIRTGTKISFRYFLWLFCIQSQKILSNDTVLFDKQQESRYRDALRILRIFDWAIGADSPKNIIIKKQLEDLKRRIATLEKKKEIEFDQQLNFKEILGDLYLEAKRLQLIKPNLFDDEQIVNAFEKIIYEEGELDTEDLPSEIDELTFQKFELQLKLNNLNKYKRSQAEYLSLMKSDADSLRPIEYIKENFDNILVTGSTGRLIDSLYVELSRIKQKIKQKNTSPFLANVDQQVGKLKIELQVLQSRIDEIPQDFIAKTEKEKYMFLGYVKSKLEDFKDQNADDSYNEKLEYLQEKISRLQERIDDFPDIKQFLLELLNDLIDKNLDILKIENYTECNAYYNENEHRLDLIDPESLQIYTMPQISSASSSMYLHLAFFLGLHELLLKQSSLYVPSFLMLDQISTPYYDNAKKGTDKRSNDEVEIDDFAESDRDKLNRALNLVDKFINRVNQEQQKDFQIILIEHIPANLWEEEGFNNFHLVDKEFKGGYKLVNL